MDYNGTKYYTEDDIRKAFDMGLETALVVFERSIGLTVDGQREMLDRIRKEVAMN